MAIRDGSHLIVSVSCRICNHFIIFPVSKIMTAINLYDMKKTALFFAIVLVAIACKKIEKEPFGPTDVRVINLASEQMQDLTVNTYDSTYNYGTLNAFDTTEYHRFDRAYVVANISAIINGLKYKTDTAIYTWKNYVGQVKISYQIWIESEAQRKLGLKLNGYDAPLD